MEQNVVKNNKKSEYVKIGFGEKFGFMGFSTATNIAFNFKSMYYLIFLDVICGLGPGLAGWVLALGTVWDAINDPLIATFCENHKFKNGEKIRPYALIASIPWAITIVLLFVNFGFPSEAKAITMIVALIIYFVFEALYTFLCMPYNSMASLATKDDHQRASINAYRGLGGCLGAGIGAVAILPLVQLFGGLKDHDELEASDSKAIIYVAIIMGVLCIAGSLLHYFTTKERVKPENEKNRNHISLGRAYNMLFRCKSWRLNMIYIIGYAIIQAFMMNNVNYYAKYIMHDSTLATPILACYLVVAIVTSIIGPMIDKKLGRRKLTLLSMIVTIAGIVPFIIFPRSIPCICILSACVGFGLTVTFIIFNTNRNSCADILEVQNGTRIDSLIAGGDNLITKLAEALAILIMTSIYEGLGMDANLVEQPPSVLTAITIFLGVACLVVAVAMTFFGYKIDTKKDLEDSIAKRDAKLKRN